MTDWALVPVKSIAKGKSRLAPILSRPQRQSLNRTLLRRTLELASRAVGRRHVVVVSNCLDAQEIARGAGVTALREPRGTGLNRALVLARDHAVSRGATGVLVLPSDLPLATLADVTHVTRAGKQRKSIVICRDRHGRGTNMLYLTRPKRFVFRFGKDSAVAHRDEALTHGRPTIFVDAPSPGFDLDTPADYRDLGASAMRNRMRFLRGLIKLPH